MQGVIINDRGGGHCVLCFGDWSKEYLNAVEI